MNKEYVVYLANDLSGLFLPIIGNQKLNLNKAKCTIQGSTLLIRDNSNEQRFENFPQGLVKYLKKKITLVPIKNKKQLKDMEDRLRAQAMSVST